jgi:hypothetical protein
MSRLVLWLVLLTLSACGGPSKLFNRSSEPDGYWLPLTVDLRLDSSVPDAALTYVDGCGQRQTFPIGERLRASLTRDMGLVFQRVHMPPTGQDVDGIVDVSLGLKELDLFIPRQTTKSYPATVTVGATISYSEANGAVLYTKNLRAEAHGTVDTEDRNCEVTGLTPIANAAIALLTEGLKKNLGTSTKVKDAAQRAQNHPTSGSAVAPLAALPSAPPPTLAGSTPIQEAPTGNQSLTYRVILREGLKNERLESGEQVTMEIEVSNGGLTLAKDVAVRFAGTPALVEQFANPVPVGDLLPNETKRVVISARVPPTEAVRKGELILSVEGANAASADQKKFLIDWHPTLNGSGARAVFDVDRVAAGMPWSERNQVIGIAIGIGAFRHSSLSPLPFAAHDAEVIAEYLTKLGGIPSDRMLLRVDDHALRDDLLEAFEEWLPQRAVAGSDVVIFIAGRAVVNRSTGAVSLIPYEGDPSAPLRLISLRRMYEALARLPIQRVVVILDVALTSIEPESSDHTPAGKEPAWSALPTGFRAEKLAQIIGTSGYEDALPYQDGRHGLMTYYVLKGMSGAADRDHNGIVAVEELCGYVRAEVSASAKDLYKKNQEPQCIPAINRTSKSGGLPLTRYRNQ